MDVWIILAYAKKDNRFLHQVDNIFDSEAAAKAWIVRESEITDYINYKHLQQYVLTLKDVEAGN